MGFLKVYTESSSIPIEEYSNHKDIQKHLSSYGILFTRWDTSNEVTKDATEQEILKIYSKEIQYLKEKKGFQSEDVISVQPDMSNKNVLRHKFLDEHTHSEDETRFFVEGHGLFYIHQDNKVLSILCQKYDLIDIPANTKHWFDMGQNPNFTCIRFFTSKEGWVAKFTGDKISLKFPLYTTTGTTTGV